MEPSFEIAKPYQFQRPDPQSRGKVYPWDVVLGIIVVLGLLTAVDEIRFRAHEATQAIPIPVFPYQGDVGGETGLPHITQPSPEVYPQ